MVVGADEQGTKGRDVRLYKAKLKSRKQIMAEIPREQQGWWADVCAGQTLVLRDATASDIARCSINGGQTRDPADYLCEACERGSLVRRIAIKDLVEIPDRRGGAPSTHNGMAMSAELMRRAGAKMANTMFNLAQRAGEVIDSDLAAKFDTMRKEWDAAVRATRPSPSTAPTDEAGERAAFEAWAQGRVTSLIQGKFGTGYVYADAARAWDAWQARASLAAKPAAEGESNA